MSIDGIKNALYWVSGPFRQSRGRAARPKSGEAEKNMKKELKAVCGMILAAAAMLSAASAGAEISIGMEPVAYSVRPAAWGQVSRPSSTDRLSAAAEGLAEAAGSGDTAKAETLLAGLFSGAARKEAAAPVYASSKPAAPAPAAIAPVKLAVPAKARRAARAKSKSMGVTEAEWILVAQEADATEEAPAAKEKEGKDEEGKGEAVKPEAEVDLSSGFEVAATEEAPKKTLLQDLLGGGIGMMIVILLICLL